MENLEHSIFYKVEYYHSELKKKKKSYYSSANKYKNNKLGSLKFILKTNFHFKKKQDFST